MIVSGAPLAAFPNAEGLASSTVPITRRYSSFESCSLSAQIALFRLIPPYSTALFRLIRPPYSALFDRLIPPYSNSGVE
jgi:hypothetical protein